jgi:protein-S-isoprenylcysteine O-methyltransferase Ste14
MEQFFLQIKIILISILGIIALLPGPNKKGERRIKGALGNVITYLGIAFLFIPWFVIPFLPQPRFIGTMRVIMIIAGIILFGVAITIELFSLKVLLPAFKKEFSEFTPSFLVVVGPYKFVRNPMLLAVFIIFFSLYIASGATLSILFLPLIYLVLRLLTTYEEKKILEPRFSSEYINYKRDVKAVILGIQGGIILGIPCLILIVMSLIDFMNVYNFAFIK